MKTVLVYYNGKLAGVLSKSGWEYRFTYHHVYLGAAGSRPVSMTLPLRREPYESEILFPGFANLLSEGSNKAMQSRLLEIHEYDYFGLLLATGRGDRIGPLTFNEDHGQAEN